MNVVEEPRWIACEGDQMLGIYARHPSQSPRAVVLIVTGGPQYRAGSHRQFTLLARDLARDGYASLRFDVRGMGDSTGNPRSFLAIDDDIGAAAAALEHEAPGAPLVLLGLCDAASAILLWLARRRTSAAGLVLINPWVRDEVTLAKAQLKHYYRARVLDAALWRKILRGRFDLRGSLGSLLSQLRSAFGKTSVALRYQDQMADGLREHRGPVLLVTSGNDLTAREFLDFAASEPNWRGLLQPPAVTHYSLGAADHTFSASASSAALHASIIEWLAKLTGEQPVAVRPSTHDGQIEPLAGRC